MGKMDKKLGLSSVFSFSWLSKLKRKSSSTSVPVKRRPSTPPAPPTNSSRSSPLPVSSITNLACSPEVYDNRTGRRIAGFVEPEEDFWRFSFRRQSFEREEPGDGSRPARRAFSVDFESITLAKPEHPPTPRFPPLNLKRAHHQKYSKDAVPRRSKKWAGPKSSARSGELCSPKKVCKVKAVEYMRRRRARPKKKPAGTRGGAMLTGFAVVKSSWDPQQDFRESMVEMMSEKKMMNAGDELEVLLACYLELNPVEFHELIVKVFRQVWSDLNRAMAAGSDLERGYFDY